MAFLIFVITVVATGCSLAKLGGRYADWYVMKCLDDAFALKPAQETELRPRVQGHLAWIKKTEIPLILTDLDELSARIRRGIVADDARWLERRIEAMKTRLDQRMRPDALWLLARLDVDQHRHMMDEMTDEISEWNEAIDESPDDFKRERLQRYEKMYREWLGSLTKGQKADLHAQFGPLAELPMAKLQTEGRIEAYGAFLNAVAPPGEVARVDAFLSTWIKDPAALRNDAAAKAFRERQLKIREGWLAIGQQMSAEQRDHLLAKLKDHRDDLAAFAKTE